MVNSYEDTMNNNSFDALGNEHRRELLVELLDENPLSDTVQDSLDVDSEPGESEQELQIAMYHLHLPKLVDYGFIGWNKDTHEVVKGPRFEEIRPLLEFVDDSTES